MSANVQQLCDMGFPADQVQAALRAAFNNADRAVEYLMNGIPAQAAIVAPPTSTGGAPGSEAPADLSELRRHPQFDALRTLVQSNPAALPTVLQQIGTQSPHLIQLIHENQEEFIRMLNEPVATTTTPAPGGLGGANPAQVVEMLNSLNPEQRTAMAAQMGMTSEQLQQVATTMSQMPPEAMAQLMSQIGSGGGSGAGPVGGAAGDGPPGGISIQLTQEEAAAVERLCAMGFPRNDVLQAYLACEKNEGSAANFLMDSMDMEG